MIEEIIKLKEHEQNKLNAKTNLLDVKKQITLLEKRDQELFFALNKNQESLNKHKLQAKQQENSLLEIVNELKKLTKQEETVSTEKALNLLKQKQKDLLEKQDELETNTLELYEFITNSELGLNIKQKEYDLFKQKLLIDLKNLNSEALVFQKEYFDLCADDELFYDGMSLDFVSQHKKALKNLKKDCVIFAIDSENCPNCGMQIEKNNFLVIRHQKQAMPCNSCFCILFYQS